MKFIAVKLAFTLLTISAFSHRLLAENCTAQDRNSIETSLGKAARNKIYNHPQAVRERAEVLSSYILDARDSGTPSSELYDCRKLPSENNARIYEINLLGRDRIKLEFVNATVGGSTLTVTEITRIN
jgi:hypothetical protein